MEKKTFQHKNIYQLSSFDFFELRMLLNMFHNDENH